MRTNFEISKLRFGKDLTSESDSDYRGGLVAALDSGLQEISLYRIGCVSYTPQFIITIHVHYFTNHSSGYSTFQCY
ncbi:hypothetical protein TNCV_3739621 [Trichonephila clavipes]|nr:hypothetical protein TNCV_3739621 [Trichonephila clavipes]